MSKKPTGFTGPIRIKIDKYSKQFKFQPINWPKEKEEIEKIIVSNFIKTIQAAGATVLNHFPNPQNDLDYTLILPGGEVYLELKEVIFPMQNDKNKNSPIYSKEPHFWNYGDIENWFLNQIKKYSKKYKGVNKPIHLLFYTTHFDYNFEDEVVWLIQYSLTKTPHIFECIFLYQPLDKNTGDLRVFYPSKAKEDFKSFQKSLGKDFINKLREKHFFNFSPFKWKIG